jgi:hypothetical protein
MRLMLRLTLVVALATLGVPPLPAQEGGLQTLALDHEEVTCMVAEQHPLIEADLVPEPSVQVGRVYFHSSLGDTFYYVEMERVGGRFVGTLPRPRVDAGPVTYYVEGVALDYTQTQTAEVEALVVEAESECSGRVADSLPIDIPVRVYSLTGSTALPPGFSGVSSVLAAGTTTAGTGGFLSSTGGRLLLGAAAVGVVTAIVVTRDDEEPPPVSPSR